MATDRESIKAILASLDKSIAATIEDKENVKTDEGRKQCDRTLADLDNAKVWALKKLRELG